MNLNGRTADRSWQPKKVAPGPGLKTSGILGAALRCHGRRRTIDQPDYRNRCTAGGAGHPLPGETEVRLDGNL